MKLTRQTIDRSKQFPTPFLLVDLEQVRRNYRKIKEGIQGAEVFYAMKANSHPQILEALAKENASFEIASLSELVLLRDLHIPPEKIICFNPIKAPKFLKEMDKQKIRVMAYDSKDEVDKIAQYAPESKLVLRIVVDNEGSDWPLIKKFGVDVADALPLLKYAKKKNLEPIGLTFHVGSQCLNKNNWIKALHVCDGLWEMAKKEGIHFNFIGLGGGIPVAHKKPIPSITEIGVTITNALEQKFETIHGNLKLTIEPGRGIIGDAAILVTSVIGKAKREHEDWVYIDAGIYNGLMETIEGFQYEIQTEKDAEKKLVTIAGPSCDSLDIPFKDIVLADVQLGDKIYVLNTGAYTTVCACNFNGFEIPNTHFLSD